MKKWLLNKIWVSKQSCKKVSGGLQCANTEEKNFALIRNMMIRVVDLPSNLE